MSKPKDAKSSNEYLHTIHEPKVNGEHAKYPIDIVFVHGLNPLSKADFAEGTWTHENGNCWPKTQLHQNVPSARIHIFSYNSKVAWDASTNGIRAHANNLLDRLGGAREARPVNDNYDIPIIFVAHSMGGLVVKQALVTAQNDPTFADIKKSTSGLVFFAVPHQGGHGTSLGKIAKNIVASLTGDSKNDLVESLSNNSLFQESQAQFFKHQLEDYQVVSIYENRPTKFVKFLGIAKSSIIVDEQSATLGLSGSREKLLTLDSNHSEVCKFEGDDDKYEPVKRAIGKLAEAAISARREFAEGQDDTSLTPPSQSRLPNTKHAQTGRKWSDHDERQCLKLLGCPYLGRKERTLRRVPETCNWVLENPKFVDWRLSNKPNLLCISADPGCGKSVLSKALVDERLVTHDAREMSICYYFFSYDDEDSQSSTKALCAILHQLFTSKPELLKHAMDSFMKHSQAFTTELSLLWDVLVSVAADDEAGEIACVLDALDECCEPQRSCLIDKIAGLYTQRDQIETRLKFIVTSRPYPEIETRFRVIIGDFPLIRGEDESGAISNEINLVIDYQIPIISRSRRFPFSTEDQRLIIASLRNQKNRTYLWLHLILEALRASLDSTKTKLQKIIKTLPASVEDAYEKVLGRIKDSETAEQARRLLHIVVGAVRPLNVQELKIMLAIDEKLAIGESCHSYEDLDLESAKPFEYRIRNLCGLFLNIIDDKVYLLHQSAKEFLVASDTAFQSSKANDQMAELWKHSLEPARSNSILTHICLTYLLLRELDGFEINPDDLPRYNRENVDLQAMNCVELRPFLVYAASNWTVHFRLAGTRGKNTLTQLAIDSLGSSERWLGFQSRVRPPVWLPRKPTVLILATFLGLETVVEQLLEREANQLNVTDGDGRTALYWAMRRSEFPICQVLLRRHDIDLRTPCEGFTPLSRAARRASPEILQLLLTKEGIEPNHKDTEGYTALSYAIKNPKDDVASSKILLKSGRVDPNIPDNTGRTPLFQILGEPAIDKDINLIKKNLVRVFLAESRVDPNLGDIHGRTPLAWAARQGHDSIVELLLEDSRVEVQDRYGLTPLSWAARAGHHDLVKRLMDKYADRLNIPDKQGRMPIDLAVKAGHKEVIELLRGYTVGNGALEGGED